MSDQPSDADQPGAQGPPPPPGAQGPPPPPGAPGPLSRPASQFSPPPGHAFGPQPGYPQPAAVPYGGIRRAKPDSNLVWAILSTVLCCMPFGVAAIVYAAKVDSLWTQGDQAGSERASRLARNWSIASAVTSLVFIVFYVAVLMSES